MPDDGAPGTHVARGRCVAKPLLLLAGLLPETVAMVTGRSSFQAEPGLASWLTEGAGNGVCSLVPRSLCKAFEVLPDKVRLLENLTGMRKIYQNKSHFVDCIVEPSAQRRRLRRSQKAQDRSATPSYTEDSDMEAVPAKPHLGLGNATQNFADLAEVLTPLADLVPAEPGFAWPFRWGAGGSVIADMLAAGGLALRQTFQALHHQLNKSIGEDATLTAFAVAGTAGLAGFAGGLPSEAARQLLVRGVSAGAGEAGLAASRAGGVVTDDLFGGPVSLRTRTRTDTEHEVPAPTPWRWLRLAMGLCCLLVTGAFFMFVLRRATLKGSAVTLQMRSHR